MYAIFRQQFELPHLKSLVFVAQPVGIFSNQVYQFINFSMGCKLTTLWCYLFELNNSNINLNNLTSVAWITSECRDQLLPINLLHPGLQLGHLESYWEPEPVLMRTVLDSPTKLKLINCYYDSNNFQNFCENHPLLEVLKLCIGRGWNIGDQTPTVWNEDSWKNFCKLRILSLKTVSIGINSTTIIRLFRML